jgi:hypothetical protein
MDKGPGKAMTSFHYNKKMKMSSAAWGMMRYRISEDKAEYQFRIKEERWIRNHILSDTFNIKEIRLHVLLHELGHIAMKDFDKYTDDYARTVAEAKAWVYASKCLKKPESVINTILSTSEDYEIVDIVQGRL